MEIKTCEQYVLDQLEQARAERDWLREKLEQAQDEAEELRGKLMERGERDASKVERAAAVAYDLELIGYDLPCRGDAS